MDWNDVRIFLAITRTGTLGAAARSLKLSHPTIGRRLQALEDALGQKLFLRTNEGLLLTDEGKSILPLAEQIEENARTIARRLAGKDQPLDGILKISSSDWLGTWILPPVLEAFASAHPMVGVELLTETRLFSLTHREADLAFRVVPFDEPDVVQRRIATQHFSVYTADGSDVPGKDCEITGIIEDPSAQTATQPSWLRQRLPDANVVLRSNSRTIQATMCARGIGIAVLPQAIGDTMPGLRRIDLGEAPPSRELWMGYHRDLRTLGRLRAFVDLAIEHLAD
jgi:DNA-binding transcriptional LysR family regulator